MLTLDPRGRVVQHTAPAERWLSELVDLGPDWREGRGLPEAIWLVIGALRQILHPPTEDSGERLPRICVHTRSGRWVQLQAALAEGNDGRAGEIVIVFSPLGSAELTWLRTSAYGLSPREQQVVELVMRGASTRAIAAALVISEYTVQDHVSHVFEKVDVRSRRAL